MDKYNQKHVASEGHRHPFLKKRPKSSPSLRSDSSSTHHQTPQSPSYQARRLERHGSSKFSRSTTALLWQHSIIKEQNTQSKPPGSAWSKAVQKIDTKQGDSWSKTLQSMQKAATNNKTADGGGLLSKETQKTETKPGGHSWSKAKQKLNTLNSFSTRSPSPRLEAWANDKPPLTKSTVLNPTASSSNLLRPQTAALLRRRLRHMVRTRIKSAAPRTNSYDDGSSGSEINDFDEDGNDIHACEQGTSSVTIKNVSKHLSKEQRSAANEAHLRNTKESKNDTSLERRDSPEEQKESQKSPGRVRKLGWTKIPAASASDISDHAEHSSELSAAAALKNKTLTAFKSSGPKSPRHQAVINEAEEDSRSNVSSENTDKDPGSTVPELRLGNTDYSIPLSSVTGDSRRQSTAAGQANRQKKTSVAEMMRRNRHSRHQRLSVYMQVNVLGQIIERAYEFIQTVSSEFKKHYLFYQPLLKTSCFICVY